MQSKIRAKKSLGQNFLRDEVVIDRIINALEIAPGDLLIEIGPGLGALTRRLVGSAAAVIAIEFDRDMISVLSREFAGADNLTILHADALTIDLDDLARDGQTAKLAANLPYNISTPILRRLIGYRGSFERMVLMLQKEVVDRILARPGSSERGYLTVLMENAFQAERLVDVPPEAFDPKPKVDSSVIALTPRKSIVDEAQLEAVVSAAFRQKRKTILNNLKRLDADAAVLLQTAGIDTGRRAETLTLAEWAVLAGLFSQKK